MTASIPRSVDVLRKATRPEQFVASRASDFCSSHDERMEVEPKGRMQDEKWCKARSFPVSA